MHRGITKALVIIFLCVAIFGSAGLAIYKLFVAPAQTVKKAMMGPRPTLPPDPSIAEYEKCLQKRSKSSLTESKQIFEDFIARFPDSPKLDDAKDALGNINMALFYSNEPSPDKQLYVIQKGDTIGAIERKTKLPGVMIMRLNKIEDPTKLRIGQVLNVSRPEFSLRINRKTKVITLNEKGRFFKQYKVQSWNAPIPKSTAPVTGKIGEKVAWKSGQRVAFGSKDFEGSGRWISVGVSGYTLYSATEDNSTPKPPGGLGLAPEDIDELSGLLNRNTPVTIE